MQDKTIKMAIELKAIFNNSETKDNVELIDKKDFYNCDVIEVTSLDSHKLQKVKEVMANHGLSSRNRFWGWASCRIIVKYEN